MTEEQKNLYRSIGETPFLDGQYTVFGEVESGLEVVEKIQQAATDQSDRPNENIELTMSIIEI